VLALEDLEMRAVGWRRRGAPHRAPRDDEAPEIFQKALELRIAGGVGDGAVEGEILINGVFAAVDGRADRGKAVGDLLDVGGRGAFGGKSGSLDFDPGAQLHHVEDGLQRRVLVEIDPERPPHMIGDEGADALPGHHQAVGPQRRHGLANDGAANPRGRDHFLLGRQLRAGRQFAADDIGGQPRHQLRGQIARRLQRLEQSEIFWCALIQWLDTEGSDKVII